MCDVIVTAAAEALKHFISQRGGGGVSLSQDNFPSSTACENKLIMTAGCRTASGRLRWLALGKLNRQGKQTVSQGERKQLTDTVGGRRASSELNVGDLEQSRDK